jgi:hypothetical protein
MKCGIISVQESAQLKGMVCMGRGRIGSVVAALLMAKAGASPIEVLAPKPDAIYGWGRQSPTIRLEVRAHLTEPAERVFITAIIANARGELIQRVSLRDDGKYGDAAANDRVFTGAFTPTTAELHQLRFKMEWVREGKPARAYSPFQAFEVVRAPYARFLNKLDQDGASVGATTRQPVALLIGDSEARYTGALDNLTLEARAEPAAVVELPKSLAPQSSILYKFQKPDKYTLYVNAVLTYKGQRIATEADSMTVHYARPNIGWFIGGVLALLLALLLPGKRIPLYTHEMQAINPKLGTRHPVEVSGEQLVRIGSRDADHPLPGYTGDAIVLQAHAGEPQVRLIEGDLTPAWGFGDPLSPGDALTPGEKYRLSNGIILEYIEAYESGARHTNPLLPNTPLKAIALFVAVALVAYYAYQHYQLQQLAQL